MRWVVLLVVLGVLLGMPVLLRSTLEITVPDEAQTRADFLLGWAMIDADPHVRDPRDTAVGDEW